MPKKQKRTRYTDEFRASAVAAAIAAGYPSIKGALSRVAREMKVSHQVLRDWINAAHNPPPHELLQEKRKDLRDLFLDEIYTLADLLPSKRANASYAQMVTAMGTFFDKVRLIDGMPTEIIGAMPILSKIADLYKELGWSASDTLEDYYQRLHAKYLEQKQQSEVAQNAAND